MSTPQRNDARVISVGPEHRELLRVQSLAVLSFNHEGFEDIMDADPAEALATATIFRDAFAVLDAVGWEPGRDTTTKGVTLTSGHVGQLTRRRHDLALAVVDDLATRDAASSPPVTRDVDRRILMSRDAVNGLGMLLAAYLNASCPRRRTSST